MCFLIFSATFGENISHSKKKERDIKKNIYWSSCRYFSLVLPLGAERHIYKSRCGGL